MSDEVNDAPVVCARKKKGERCGTEIPLTEENLKVMRPEVPLLSAICPECGYSNPLKKDVSIRLIDELFDGDVDNIIGGSDDSSAGFDPMAASSDILADRVVESLGLFGYNSKKWKQSVGVVKEFVRDVAEYQTQRGLSQLLGTLRINNQHIPLIVQRSFGGNVAQNVQGQYNMGQIPNQQNVGYPQGATYPNNGNMGVMQSGMPTMMGGGQQPVIVMPPQPAQSVVRESSDGFVVEETVKDGDVVKRTTRHNGAVVDAPKSEMDSLISMIALMKEMGVMGNNTPPPPAPTLPVEVLATLDSMTKAISQMGEGQKRAGDDVAYQRETDQRNEVRTMSDKIDEMRQAQHKEQIDAMRNQMDHFADIAKNGNQDGLNDSQFKVSAQSDNLKTLTGTIESMGEQIVGPLMKMQMMQAEMQAMFMMRNAEGQDGVAAGTYSSMNIDDEVPADQVAGDLNAWKQRVNDVKKGGVNQ